MFARLVALAGMSLALVAQDRPVLIRQVRVFDGTKVLKADSVVLKEGRISRIGTGLTPPAGAEVIEGRGRTLLPGLVDAHTHTWGLALEQALLFGVTTELDMFAQPAFVKAAKARPKATTADLRSAGTLATAPGGHGTEYGFKIPTLTRPEEAQAFVDARLAEGSDYLKIVLDAGHAYGLKFPTLDAATVKALVEAAHRRGTLAVAHIGSLEDAKVALRAGVDGLVHTFEDAEPDQEFVELALASKAFVVPTLSVNASVARLNPGKPLAEDSRIGTWLSGGQKGELLGSFPGMKQTTLNYAFGEASVRRIHQAGVPILAGSDAPNAGTTHGATMHGELARLVAAGLTPAEALQAATANPAKHFRLKDRGRIRVGLRADLLLVDGDPTRDITATRAIVKIWKQGIALDRTTALAALPKDAQPTALAEGSGPIGAFEGSLTAASGLGWMPSTDQMTGGKSTVNLELATDGASSTKGSLILAGRVDGGLPYAWAGTIWFPGAQGFAPVDYSTRKALTFWAKGDGKTYRVLVYSALGGMRPSLQTFVAGAEWKAYTFPLTDFPGVDPKALTAVAIVAGSTPGEFRFQLDEVGFN